jgi:4-amino-4-deoxy-L-arabinose transferase-like glycosyltransferase
MFKVRGWHLFLFAFVVFSFFILKNFNNEVLTGDEVFYYFQAEHIKNGEYVWFEHTQPVLMPFLLSLYPGLKLVYLRIFFSGLLFGVCALLVFELGKRVYGWKSGVLASLIFILNKESVNLAGWLYTEGLFVAFMLASFLVFYEIYSGKRERWRYLALGVFMGLGILTRVVGFILPVFFSVFLVFKKRRLFDRNFVFSLIVSGVLALVYFLFGSFTFLKEKSGGVYLFNNLVGFLYGFWGYFGVFFLGLVFLGFFSKRYKKEGMFLYFVLYYLVLLMLVSNMFLVRYLYPVVPFLSLFVSKLGDEKGVLKKLFFVLVIGYFLVSFMMAWGLPKRLSQNYYLSLPEGCDEIKEFRFSCYGGDKVEDVELPYFGMPVGSFCRFEGNFSLDEDKNYLYIGYIDDFGTLSLDNFSIRTKDVWEPTIVNKKIVRGRHSIRVDVTNNFNIGGLGQVLVCREMDFMG